VGIDKEQAASALRDIGPEQVALAQTLAFMAEDYVYSLANMLNSLNAPREFAVARITDSMLMKIENAYGKVTRDEWIKIYDDIEETNQFLVENPELLQPVRDAVIAGGGQLNFIDEADPRNIGGVDLSDLDAL
jgi:hypothetical protein